MDTIPDGFDEKGEPRYLVVDNPHRFAHKKINKAEYGADHIWGTLTHPDGRKAIAYVRWNEHFRGHVLYDPHTGRAHGSACGSLEDIMDKHNFVPDGK